MSAPPEECDIAVVGAGIVGLAVARELARRRPRSLCVLEADEGSRATRPRATAAWCTPASTTGPARSRRGCAWRARASCTSCASARACATNAAARSSWPATRASSVASTSSSAADARTACRDCDGSAGGDRGDRAALPRRGRAAFARHGHRRLPGRGASAGRRARRAHRRGRERRAADGRRLVLTHTRARPAPASRSSAPGARRRSWRGSRARRATRASSASAAPT